MLSKHLVTDAVTREDIDHFLRSKTGGAARAMKPLDGENRLRCSTVQSNRFEVFSITCKFDGTFDFEPFEDIRLVFPIQSFVRVKLKGATLDIDPQHSNYIVPAETPFSKELCSKYRVLSTRFKPADLMRKLEALSGEHHANPIEFDQPDPADKRYDQFVRRPLFEAARELDEVDPAFHDNLLEDIRALTLTRLLLLAPHNYSHVLKRKPQAPSRAQMRLAEDYLANGWDKPINVSGLAEATGVSARTVLRHFRCKYGETPREHLRRLRLERARDMLRTAEDATITTVALSCGFSSLGHFAQSYFERFGELPSDTRRRTSRQPKPDAPPTTGDES